MKPQASVWIVLLVTMVTVGVIAFLSQNPFQDSVEAAQASSQSSDGGSNGQLAANPSNVSPVLDEVDVSKFLDPVPVGKKAPDFSLKDAFGHLVRLSQFKAKKNVVIVFYSGSKCPVCGKQLENLQSHMKDFNDQDAEIIAISADDATHAKQSVGEHGLSFTVIPDPQKEVIKKYGISNLARQGSAWPASFIVDKSGVVRFSIADPHGKRLHSNELLPELAKITKRPAPKLGYDE